MFRGNGFLDHQDLNDAAVTNLALPPARKKPYLRVFEVSVNAASCDKLRIRK